MPLISCPECRHAVSTNATACPNCGYILPIEEPIVVRNVIEPESNQKMPQWIIIPAVAMVAIVFVVIIVLLRNNGENENARNVNVDLSKAVPSSAENKTKTIPSQPSSQIVVPPSSTTVNPPSQTPSSTTETSQRTTVTPTSTTVSQPDKAIVKIEAKVVNKNGNIQSVKNEKFYLLDEDIETILNNADLEPIEFNSLINSFGLSVMYPERYQDFNREALDEIKKHIKYSTLTDAGGKTSLADVKPDKYYLFGITKSKTGFAIWNAPVSINEGENTLNLSPASFNDFAN
ncbi:MAG: zinc ribbon domain-containing protein [Blastocatellia bacterium]|nr:zinc ribbon domain-containing protein [Blastocatellia bacterium]